MGWRDRHAVIASLAAFASVSLFGMDVTIASCAKRAILEKTILTMLKIDLDAKVGTFSWTKARNETFIPHSSK